MAPRAAPGDSASSMNRAMSSSRKVSVSLACVPIVSDQSRCWRPLDHETLDDEPVGRLEQEDVLHPALVEERPDRAEDLLEVLARAALVDPHRGRSSAGTPASGGPSVRPPDERPDVPGRVSPMAAPSTASAGTRESTRTSTGLVGRCERRGDRTAASSPAPSAAASCARDAASLTISAVLARTDAPSVSSAIRASSQGVSAGPPMPAAAASAIGLLDGVRGRRRRGGRPPPGPGRRRGSPPTEAEPEVRPRRSRRGRDVRHRRRRARARATARRTRAARPARRRRPGRRASRGTRASPGRRGSPSGRRTRRPSACGRAPRGPTRCRTSAGPARDAASAPRWTPPIPPVAKTRIPAACAAIIVAETVVAAQPPSASATARLGRAALRTDPAGAVASAWSAASSSPTRSRPAWIATVAGHRAAGADGRLGRARDLEVLRVRQAVADQRRLERDDRPALGEGGRRPRAGCRVGR